jgi:hypothetical protein
MIDQERVPTLPIGAHRESPEDIFHFAKKRGAFPKGDSGQGVSRPVAMRQVKQVPAHVDIAVDSRRERGHHRRCVFLPGRCLDARDEIRPKVGEACRQSVDQEDAPTLAGDPSGKGAYPLGAARTRDFLSSWIYGGRRCRWNRLTYRSSGTSAGWERRCDNQGKRRGVENPPSFRGHQLLT